MSQYFFEEPYVNGENCYSLCKCNTEGEARRIEAKLISTIRELSGFTVDSSVQKSYVQLLSHKTHLETMRNVVSKLNSLDI